MRILLAIDGSAAAGRAQDLVDGIAWPAGTLIRVVSALEHGSDLVGFPGFTPTSDESGLETSLVRRLQDALDASVLDLAAPGREVERVLLRGRAATAVVAEARDFGADLIVVGHRGHGRLETMLLGSVSAEIVDHAPCPVLVARGPELHSLLLAVDGSAAAEHAEHTLFDWPLFRGMPVHVVTVAEVGMPWSTGMSPGIYDQVLESYSVAVDDARQQCHGIAESAATRLVDSGYVAVAEVREGSPAEEIVAAAATHRSDLIVVGTRGHTGLARLVLGSVARNVLLHAPCSVLVVREKAHVEPVAAAEIAR